VSSCGFLQTPNIPDISGRNRFLGESCHSSQWNPDLDVTGKRVAIVGTGASAVQIAPAIVDKVKKFDFYEEMILLQPKRVIFKLKISP
jgi:cation diffusion facilitator CzcD-associated flavoprotein CzcO